MMIKITRAYPYLYMRPLHNRYEQAKDKAHSTEQRDSTCGMARKRVLRNAVFGVRSRLCSGLYMICYVVLLTATLFSLPITAYAAKADAPESATAWQDKPAVWGKQHMLVTANPLATAAGLEMLRIGGSATDAAIAAQLVLGLVEPQSSGLGGGGMMLVFEESGQKMHAYDGRETAPESATQNLFLRDGSPMSFDQAVVGGLSVGVPGLVRMLSLVHQRHGKLPWKRLFDPAIKLAEKGFIISPRMANLLAKETRLYDDLIARQYFYDEQGKPKAAGIRLRNPALARTLRILASRGPEAFYRGKIAQNIVATIRRHPSNPGLMQLKDLQNYQAKEREAVCGSFRQWLVCGAPPPSSGGIAVAQMLGILSQQSSLASVTDKAISAGGAHPLSSSNSIKQWSIDQAHYFSEAGKLAFADRDRYIADSDFVPLPGGTWRTLLNPGYLAQRSMLIRSDKSMGKAQPGTPEDAALSLSSQTPDEALSTTHLSVVDAYGQAVSMTSSVETAFGAHIMTPDGFLLNNQLTDFSFVPERDGKLIANRVQANKRPRSSMSPSIILENGRLKMIVGSPGGPNIINYVAKVIMATLDWGYTLPQAVRLANIGSRNENTEVESGQTPTELITALEQRGHLIKVREMNSGLHAILRMDLNTVNQSTESAAVKDIISLDQTSFEKKPSFIWQGVADPRREGIALAD